ncbi:T9SS type A sorting domain-containing protein [Dyadobacter sp. 676]|uniref:T9SS type A sorting domain-containing protein n=1 Tax=Dyadobacter sp. 676 TaxID=3088362 RepID=A0AAU8FGK5_9BACT
MLRDVKVDGSGTVYGGAWSAGNTGTSLVALDNSGNRLWAKDWGSNIGYISISPDNSVYITGYYSGSETFGSTTLTSAGGLDVFVAKTSTSGNIEWAKSVGGPGDDNPVWISSNQNGEVLVGGWFDQIADFDPNECVYNLSSTASTLNSGYVLKLTERPFPDGVTLSASTLSPMTQQACILGIPQVIQGNAVGITAPSGYSTSISYQWQKATSPTGLWTNMEGEVFKDLQPLASSETLYYRRIVLGKSYFCRFDTLGVSEVASVTIGSNAAPLANANGPQWYVCGTGNNTVTLNGSATSGTGPYGYQWYQGSSNGGTLVGSAANFTTPAVTQATTYTLKVTDASGCIDTDQVTIVPAVANAGPDQSFCQGSGGVQIGSAPVASQSVVYAWTRVSGSPVTTLSCTNCAQPIANPTAATVYRLTVTVTKKDGTTCSTTDDITVTPVTAPGGVNAFAGPDRTICINSSVQLGSAIDATYAYNWTPGQFLNATDVARPTFTAGSSGLPTCSVNYTVTAVKNGCSFVDEVKVAVLNSTTSDTDDTECGPRWVTHEGFPNCPEAVYTWTVVSGNGTVLSTRNGGADAYLKSNTGTTVFRRTVTLNGVSCFSEVNIIPCGGNCDVEIETISAQGCPKSFPGEELRLAPKYINTTDWNYRWSPANLVDNATAREVKVLASNPATITLTITNKYDPSITCSESIDINPAGAAKPNINLADKFACYNSATPIGTNLAGYAYKWSPSVGLDNDSIPNPMATLTADQQYVVEIEDLVYGCKTIDTVNVKVARVVVDAGVDRTICNGATVTLGTPAPTGTNWTYAWQPTSAAWTNGTNATMPQPQVEFSATGGQTFILTVTDPESGCAATDSVTLRNELIPGEYASKADTICQGESIQLGRAPEPGVTYQWSGAGLSCTDCANPIATPTATTTYSLQISYPGCTSPMVDEVTITVNPVPAVTLNDATACSAAGVAIGFGANGNPAAPAGATFLWSPSTGLSSATVANPTATVTQRTTYSVTVTLPSGCTFTDEIEVTPNAGAGSDVTICPGESTQIGTPAIEGATYAWTGAGIVGAANVAQPTIRPTVTTTYTVTVTTASCTSTDQVVVTVNTPAAFNITGNTTICAGGTTTLSLVGSPAAGTSWQWSPTAGVSSPNATSTTIAPTATTTYRLTQTNLASGCSNFKEVVVVVNPNTIAANATPLAVCSNASVAMSLNVTSTGNYQYVWTPSTGLSNAFIANPTVSTGTARTYTVTITDTDSKCQLVQSVPVSIKPAAECLAPVSLRGNVFHDANGLTDVTVNTTSPVAIPTGLHVSLIGSDGTLLSTVEVGANGTFDFGLVNADTYSIVLHQTAGGSITPSLPSGWLNMGENLGAGAGSDDAVNGVLTNVQVVNVDVTNANFGIEVAPSADPYHRIIDQPSVGDIVNLSGSLPELTGSDPEDQPTSGSLSGKSVVITTLPTNTTLLYNGQPVMAGVEIRSFDPLKLQVQFTQETIGDINTSFEYAWVDAAGVQGSPAIYSLEWEKPLPVTLVSFQAHIQEGKTILNWATTEETNSDRFEIEHSTSGKAWTKVGTVLAKGESKGRVSYDFEHKQPVNGENLYRLKMIDADETFAYSAIRSVRLDVHSELTAYPNPVSDRLMIRNYQQIKQVVLHNAAGVKIYQSQKLTSEGIDVSKLQQGTYTITMTLFDGTISTHKVAVIR